MYNLYIKLNADLDTEKIAVYKIIAKAIHDAAKANVTM